MSYQSNQDTQESLESISKGNVGRSGIVSKSLISSLILAGLSIVGIYAAAKSHSNSRQEIKQNLSQNAIYISQTVRGETFKGFPVMGYNDDLDNDGKYESILVFENPVTKEHQRMLIEKDPSNPEQLIFRDFEIDNGKIIYK